MVGHGERHIRTAHLAARRAQAFKRLRAGDLMHQMAVDIDQAGAVILPMDNMAVPDFIIEGLRSLAIAVSR